MILMLKYNMSLRKKIMLSFFLSASIIVVLVIFEYFNFQKIMGEIRYLENAELIRNKSIQIRRHEARFFLYGFPKAYDDASAIRQHLNDIRTLLSETKMLSKAKELPELEEVIKKYEVRFDSTEALLKETASIFSKMKPFFKMHKRFFPLMDSFFIDHPVEASYFLKNTFMLSPNHRLFPILDKLDSEISSLRNVGEKLLFISSKLDKQTRFKMEEVIKNSQTAIWVLFPLFFIIGIGTIFVISNSIVKRLTTLIEIVEQTGKDTLAEPFVLIDDRSKDEVGVLMRKFNTMEIQLASREKELEVKKDELFQSNKLAAIGTLVSGIAHELNNPLNNVYISAQALVKEAGNYCSVSVQEMTDDILSQISRVKHLVNDLLNFSKGREPQFIESDLTEMIPGVFRLISKNMKLEGISFVLENQSDHIIVEADPELLKVVFINLLRNAIEATRAKHNKAALSEDALQSKEIHVKFTDAGSHVHICIIDAGIGIKTGHREKIFEPFFTTKDSGTGLGLSIVYSIIQKHGGKLSVQSSEGEGTVFTITLPKRRGHGI